MAEKMSRSLSEKLSSTLKVIILRASVGTL